jgi:hypothetical protein
MTNPLFTVNKQPSEKLAFTIDFTNFIPSPVPLSSVAVKAERRSDNQDSTSAVIDSSAVVAGTNKVTVTFKAGANGEVHDISVKVTGSDTQVAEADGALCIVEEGIPPS